MRGQIGSTMFNLRSRFWQSKRKFHHSLLDMQDAKNQTSRLSNESLLLNRAKSARITVMECIFPARISLETNFLQTRRMS